MPKLDLRSFSTSDLRSAGVLRDTCSEPTVCRHHGYVPPCELCEIEGDATLVCTVCGATLPSGTPSGTPRDCQAAGVLASGKGPGIPLSLTPAMESSLAELLRRRGEEEAARLEDERKARERAAADRLAAERRAEADRRERDRLEALARRGVMPGFYAGLGVVAILAVHVIFGLRGSVMAGVGAIPAFLLGLGEGIGAAVGLALVGGLAGFLAGAAAYVIAMPFGRPGPIGMALLSVVILSAASLGGGLIAQLGRGARIAAVLAIIGGLAGLAWLQRPHPQWTAEDGAKMVRLAVNRSGQTVLHYYDDEWTEYWGSYTSRQPFMRVTGCVAHSTRATCSLVAGNGTSGTLEFSLDDGAGSVSVSNSRGTASATLVPTASARELRALVE